MILILVVFGIYLGALFYVPFRFGRLISLKRSWWLYVMSLGALIVMIFGMSHRHSSGSMIVEIMEFISMTWMGFFMYVLILLLIFELANFIKKLPPKKSGIIILILSGFLSLYAMWNAHIFSVISIDIPLKGLNSDLKIVQLSDLHIGPQRGKRYLEKIVKEANDQNPDLILITGDMIDGNNTLEGDLLSPLKQLNAPAYFSTGNHESYVDFHQAIQKVKDLHIRVLRNERIDTHGIQLIGMDYMNVDRESVDMHSVNKTYLEDELPKIKISSDIPSILMFHSPKGVEVANKIGIDLVISGHTHAGQLFPASIVARWIFKYNRGLFKYKDTTLYVSQGAGTVGPRMRLGTINEVTVITLKSDFPKLKGPYLGQDPPGSIPKVFAPGVICTDEHEGSSGFMLEGKVFVFQKFINRECHTYELVQKEGLWNTPRRIPFWELLIHNGDFIVAPDDRTMFFQVKNKVGDNLISNIWTVQRNEKGWGDPKALPYPINTQWNESFASETASKTLYFFSNRPGGLGNSDLYYSKNKNGNYLDPVNLGVPINTPYHEWDPFVSLGENYLIYCSTKPGGFGGDDFYISFHHNDRWTEPVNMGDVINSSRSENRPYITNDGKYFFFTSSRRGNRDIYWVDITFLDTFRK